jgi:hypothetical protein
MIAHAIERHNDTGWLDWVMFHGMAERGGKRASQFGDKVKPLDTVAKHPPVLYRNAYRMPAIFDPIGAIVVSAAVRDLLAELDYVRWSPVQYGCLFHVPWEPRKEQPALTAVWAELGHDDLRFCKAQTHRPDLVDQVGVYWDAVIPWAENVGHRHFRVAVPRVSGVGDPQVMVPLSPDLLDRYPLLQSDAGLLLRDDWFRRLSASFDFRFFNTARFRI